MVSLLRPEIIRDLDLPGHGLQILPLESTLTPLPNGDYLAAWADHDLTRQELVRHSSRDAEAYDEFGRLMHHMAMAVRPILGMIPRSHLLKPPGALLDGEAAARHFGKLGPENFHALSS